VDLKDILDARHDSTSMICCYARRFVWKKGAEVVLANQRFAERFSLQTEQRVQQGKVYWTNVSTLKVKSVKEISGEFRLLTPNYPTNIRLLKDRYGIEPNDGQPVFPKDWEGIEASNDLIFDFSISIRERVVQDENWARLDSIELTRVHIP